MNNLESKLIKFLDLEKNSILHLAVAKNDIELVKELIEAGADINAINAEGESVLTLALRLKDKTLFSQYFPTLNFETKTKETLLKWVTTQNVSLLEPYQLDTKKVMNVLNILAQNKTPLHCAVETYSLPLIEKLLADGANPNELYFDKTPLHHVYNYINKKQIKTTDLIKVLALFRQHGHNEAIEVNSSNLAEYILHHAKKPNTTLLSYLLEEGYQLDLFKPRNLSLLKEIKLSEDKLNKYIFDKITENNYTQFDFRQFERSSQKELVFKFLDMVKNNDWKLNYTNHTSTKVYKNNAQFYFNLMIMSDYVIADNVAFKIREYFQPFISKIDLNETVKYSINYSHQSHESSLAAIIYNTKHDLKNKLMLEKDKINFHSLYTTEKEQKTIASIILVQFLDGERVDFQSFLPFINFNLPNEQGETVLHEVLKHKNVQARIIRNDTVRLTELLNEIVATCSLDSSIQNKDKQTIINILNNSKLPEELKEKLMLSNVAVNKMEKSKLKI